MYLLLIIILIILIILSSSSSILTNEQFKNNLRISELFRRNINNTNMKNYDIQEISNFLTDEECNKIIELTNNNLTPSRVYSDKDDIYSNDTRISNQTWLEDNSHPIIKQISDRVRQYTHTYNNYQEPLQVVNYPVGGFFSPHYDACEGNKEFCERMNGQHGPRLFTVLFYLNDNFTGGETVFPKINKIVKPEKGKAVIFRNVDNNSIIINQALHGGEPIKSGEKWIANKWIRIGS
jgi:prolyl 4-hydroxylase